MCTDRGACIKSQIFQNILICKTKPLSAQTAGGSITQLPHAGWSAVELCGEAVHRSEAEMVCDQERKRS